MREVPEDERHERLRMLREQAERDAEALTPRRAPQTRKRPSDWR
jgi:hypothetical protein